MQVMRQIVVAAVHWKLFVGLVRRFAVGGTRAASSFLYGKSSRRYAHGDSECSRAGHETYCSGRGPLEALRGISQQVCCR